MAGILTGIVDGLFSSILSVAFYGSTIARLFQGVASTLVGPGAIDGGSGMTALGILMHFGVAFAWTAVFALLASRFQSIRRALARPGGPLAIATVYGPAIWMVMSLVVIPQLTHRPTTITYRWWIQLIGHIPFVALPIATIVGLPLRR